MPDCQKPLEVYEVVEQMALVLQVLLYDDLSAEGLFYFAPSWSKTCLFFCQQFLSFGLESVEVNSEHDHAEMADQANGTIVLTLLEVTFLWQKYDKRVCPLLVDWAQNTN